MGTNYYLCFKPCPTCGHSQEQRHIGKSSAGWRFLFHYVKGTTENVEDWKSIINTEIKEGAHIADEDGKTITPEQFWKMVEEQQKDTPSYTRVGETVRHIGNYDFAECDFR